MSVSETYPKFISQGAVKLLVMTKVNGYEIINEYIEGDRPGQRWYDTWIVMDGKKQLAIKDKKGKFIRMGHFINQEEAETFAKSQLPNIIDL